jgi:hypothetical protein
MKHEPSPLIIAYCFVSHYFCLCPCTRFPSYRLLQSQEVSVGKCFLVGTLKGFVLQCFRVHHFSRSKKCVLSPMVVTHWCSERPYFDIINRITSKRVKTGKNREEKKNRYS